ncbi:MAG: NAD(P)/FAD-dependent oxidoreductase [Vulcanimicrobiota bacterium]
MPPQYDLIVVGSGVNGMVCALLAARQGLRVLLAEAYRSLGGGVRTEELTLPGFRHDVCAAVHPFGRCSPVLRSLELESEGLEWIDPPMPLAHPLPGEEAVLLHREIAKTAAELGPMGRIYSGLMHNLGECWEKLQDHLLGPALRLPGPALWGALARFGPAALAPASLLGSLLGKRGAALWAGLAGHSLLPMEAPGSSAVACVLGSLAHRVGWPIPRGGSSSIAVALENKLRAAGVEIVLNHRVRQMRDLPPARAVALDLSAGQLLEVVGPLLKPGVRRQLERYRLGPGVYKVDYALAAPVPWEDPRVSLAGTVHIGGSLQQISRSERAVWQGRPAPEPFLLGVQPSLFDSTRAPLGKHVFWVYLHTPNGWTGDCLELLEGQMERYAPGFKEVVLGRAVRGALDFQAYNPNYIGGDILGGANSLKQIVARPILSTDPYHIGGNLYCCSASVPPGGGVHGMAGFHAFQSMARKTFRIL